MLKWLKMRIPPLTPAALLILAALFLALPMNGVFWRQLLAAIGTTDAHALKTLLLFALILSSFFVAVLSPFAGSRLLKPVLTLLLLPTALAAYFMNQYGVMIDADMVANAVQTDIAEAGDLVTARMLGDALIFGVLPTALLWLTPLRRETPWRSLRRRAVLFVAAATVCLGTAFVSYQELASVFRNHRQLRLVLLPTNYLHAASSYLRRGSVGPTAPLQRLGEDAHRRLPARARPPQLLVLVVGETARADHFSLNGYARPTTPELAAIDDLINVPEMRACGTATAVSVPCMFSGLGRAGFSDALARAREGLLDVVQRAGVEVLWLDNNSGCKGVCDRVPSVDIGPGVDPALCGARECFDEVLVREVAKRIGHLTRDTLLVLHQKGSHGPAYAQRYPKAFERFTPACQTAQIDRCSQQEIINAYDNTLAYSDHVLAQLIALLRAQAPQRATALMYLSDHGESLGEHGLYLHGAPYLLAPDAQTRVPALFWLSDGFAGGARIDRQCLRSAAAQPSSHDHLFHTVLGLLAIDTHVYRRDLDLSRACDAAVS